MNIYPRFWLFVTAFLLSCPMLLYAQPSNNTCYTPIQIPGASNWCSASGAYTSVGATPSGYGAPTCWGNAGNDVWFSFVATGTDVTITVIGAQSQGSGGTLTRPQVALYLGTCGGTINQMGCASAALGANAVDLYEGGMVPGQTYLVRIQGANNGTGTFQICLNNYNAPANPGSDCISAAVLCDKSPFVVQSITGAGSNPDEAANSCLGGLGSNSESNSTWFKWTCASSGTLTFTLTPNNPPDDLDFVVYELVGGINSCNKTELRCMAAGDFTYPSPCMGPTGLNMTSTDVTETAGCGGNKDNFVKYIDMVAGRSYALLINNFTSAGNGFGISWGGTGTFLGPVADFIASPAVICAGQSVTFNDNSSFSNGSITSRTWSFGVGATPVNSTTVGPHTVTYSTPGQKAIALTVTTSLGCIVTDVEFIQVDSCCQTLNAVSYTSQTNNVLCNGNSNGSIALTPTGNPALPLSYLWSNGQTGATATGLSTGNYAVTVSNGICTATDTLPVGGPPPWLLQSLITRPTCDGGTDGAIVMSQVAGSNGAPYQFNWNNTGFSASPSYTGLSNGTYSLTLLDGLGCDTTLQFEVHELQLEINYQLSQIQNPSCYGYSDGRIEIQLLNGLAPYSFHWSNGATSNLLANLPAGTYTLDTIWDANRCRSWQPTVFTLTQPDTLTAYIDAYAVYCHGDSNGVMIPHVAGGTYPYYYAWSNGVNDSLYTAYPPGLYALLVTDANGCTATAQATVASPPPMFIDSVHTVRATCYGYGDGQIEIFASGGRPWTWGYTYSLDPDRLFTQNNLFIRPTGTYTVYAEDSMGCRAWANVTVEQPNAFFVDAGPDRTVDLGDTIGVYAGLSYVDFYDYLWYPVDSGNGQIDCPGCRGTGILPYNTGCYVIEIRNATGCLAVDTLCVTVNKKRNIFIPNAFTPNGDGINELLMVYSSKGVAQVRDFKVFDRWGEMVYHGKNILPQWAQGGWDGRYRGRDMPSGVFVYLIEVEFLDGVVLLYKGDVTLIR